MKLNKWTVGLAAAGVVSLASAAKAEEAKSAVQTMLSHTTISGYVDTSAIWKFGTDGVYNSNLPGRSFDGQSKQDGFNLNVVKLTIEKPLDEGQWAAGYKVDLLYGPDANSFGSASFLNTGSADFAVKQAYVALRVPVGNGLDFKVGVWDTIIGYEVFEAGNNPNYSRSYGYFLEPFIHTGVLASYRVADFLTLSAGVADDGSLNSINNRGSSVESGKTYMGSIALTAPESFGFLKGSTLYGGVIDTSQGGNNGLPNKVNLYTGVTLATPVTGLTVGASYDYVSHGTGAPTSSYANAVGIYTSFQATDKLRLNIRGEYASGTPGSFTDLENGNGTGKTFDNPFTLANEYNNEEFIGVTATIDYALWANVVSRLEFRWDHDASGGVPAFGGTVGNAQKNATSLALNVIYKF